MSATGIASNVSVAPSSTTTAPAPSVRELSAPATTVPFEMTRPFSNVCEARSSSVPAPVFRSVPG